MKKVFRDPVFDSRIIICIKNYEIFESEIRKAYKDRFDKFFDKKTHGHSIGAFIYIHKIDLPLFIHELNHWVDGEFKFRGIKDQTGEVKSYLMEYYTRKVLKWFKELEKNNEKQKKRS